VLHRPVVSGRSTSLKSLTFFNYTLRISEAGLGFDGFRV